MTTKVKLFRIQNKMKSTTLIFYFRLEARSVEVGKVAVVEGEAEAVEETSFATKVRDTIQLTYYFNLEKFDKLAHHEAKITFFKFTNPHET